jgi:hypothetical protein
VARFSATSELNHGCQPLIKHFGREFSKINRLQNLYSGRQYPRHRAGSTRLIREAFQQVQTISDRTPLLGRCLLEHGLQAANWAFIA